MNSLESILPLQNPVDPSFEYSIPAWYGNWSTDAANPLTIVTRETQAIARLIIILRLKLMTHWVEDDILKRHFISLKMSS